MSKVQITAFTGEYHFLSNYCACPITIDGLTYRSAEAAFQAAKCNVPIDRAAFCTVPPNVAKAIGRKIKLRKGWEKERDGIMADVIHAKFSQNPALAQALIDTGDADLLARLKGDWDKPDRWDMTALAEMKLGRGVLYESALFHSRWPFAAFGDSPDTGRLIAVAFFTPRE